MDTSSRKTSLVVLFNHQYDRNIPVIREIYSRRFSGLLQLMPYYKGDAPDVCSVFGNSFQFYNYILQARERIMELDGDYILIIGDDLLLNPRFDEFSTPSLLGIHGEDTCYLDGFVDVSLPVCSVERWKPTVFPRLPPALMRAASTEMFRPTGKPARF
ncbi:hypothetical protein [Akkermansia sp.]|uniref:hypothetical protein n=1 Tax=Akkermansia sp. TaxID=1872421 RepID=UPI0025BC39F0|nr:hypothetical protein [Akkermansia sp.]MCD8064115.1 hypothetical protein [Akkermansia sp.]